MKQVTQYQMNQFLSKFQFRKQPGHEITEYFSGELLIAKVHHPVNVLPTYWILE